MDIFTPLSNPLDNPLIPVQDDPLGLKSLKLSSSLVALPSPQPLELLQLEIANISETEGVDVLTGLPSIPQIPDEVIAGDISRDGGVDNTDSNLIYADRGKPVIGTEDPRDIDRDGRITLRDVALLSRRVQANTDKTGPLLGLDLVNDLNGVTNDPLIGGTITDTNRVTRFKAGLEGKGEADYFNIRGTIGNDGSFILDKGRLEEINNGALSDGLHTLSFFAKDEWNNITRSSLVFTLDTTKPVIEVGLSNDTGSSNVDQLTSLADITGKITEANTISSFKAGFDNNNFVDITAQLKADKTFSLDSSILKLINGNLDLSQGQHTLKLIAIDGVGNATDTISFTFTLDSIAPTQPNFALDSAFDAAPLGDSRTNFAQVGLYGQTEGNIKVSLVGTDKQTTASATGQFTFTDVALDIGNNSLIVQALDLAGNSSLFTAQIARVTETSSDVVIDWNATLLNAIRTDKTNPPLASRNMALVHAAIFDAVNGITGDYNPYHVTETGPGGASAEAAAASAAHRVLVSLYPSQKPSFDQALTASLAQVIEGAAKTAGINYGEQVGDAILLLRSNDGSNRTVNYTPGTNPGEWRPTPPGFAPPLYPYWGTVTPFAMTDGSQFRPDGPPALNSQEYTTEYNLVKDLGKVNSTTRTADQTEIAKFWADGSGTFTPPGHWNQIAEQVAANTNSSLVENARLFALLNIGLADAGITCWDGKYTYNFWRPITAIREGDNDGNADTVGDSNWTSLIVTPPFPEYASGHSTFSGAGSTILGGILGNNISFATNSLGLPGVSRSFNSFSSAADEAGISRIYGGIHFSSANEDGLASGRALGAYVLGNFLLPKAGDTTPPNITAALVSDTGSSNSDGITNNPNIAGVVTDSSAITSFRAKLDNGTFVDVLGTLENGSFTLDSAKLKEINGNADLGQGQHTLSLEATDAGANISPSVNYTFTLDTVVLVPSIGNVGNETTTLDVTYNEAVSDEAFNLNTYTLTSNNQGIAINSVTKVSNTLARLNLASPLTAGDYQLAIEAGIKDVAGNSLDAENLSFTAAAPSLTFEPLNGEELVSLTRDSVVRFGTKVKPETVTDDAFYLIANGSRLAGTIKVSSTQEFATFIATDILPASTEVRMVVDGSKILSQNGVAIDADGDGLAGGVGTADFTTLPTVRIAGTDIWGYVYDSYNKNPDGTNKPLEGVEIRLDFLPDVKAVTNAQGYFILEDVPAPDVFVYIDGSKAINAPAGTQYASLGKPFHSVPGQSTQLFMDGVPFNIYLPPMAIGDVKQLSPTEVTDVGFGEAAKALLQQNLPNVDPSVWDLVAVTFAPGSAQDREGNAATQATIVPVAPDRLPAPLPPGVDPKLVISIQAGGANGFNREAQGGSTTFDVPAPLQFPNLEGLAPGEKALFWSFDHTAGQWIVIGTGTVSEDGKVIKSDEGVGVLAPGWHFVNPGSPTQGPPSPPPPPEPCLNKDEIIDTVVDALATIAKCGADLSNLEDVRDWIRDAANLSTKLVNLKNDITSLITNIKNGSNVGAIKDGLRVINFAKEEIVPRVLKLKEFTPIGKLQGIISCANQVLGVLDNICGRITEQPKCNTPGVRVTCILIGLAKAQMSTVNSYLSQAENGLKGLALAFLCSKIEQAASILGIIDSKPQNQDIATFSLGATEANLSEDDPVPSEVLQLLLEALSETNLQLGNVEFATPLESTYLEAFESSESGLAQVEIGATQIYFEFAGTPSNAFYLIEYNNFQLRGRTDAQGKISVVLPPKTEFSVQVYDPETGHLGRFNGKTSSSGSPTKIPPLKFISTSELDDTDGEGLVDEAEKIIGTLANKKDTDSDGISDSAELEQGLDPLGGQGFPTGIISSLPLLGEAKGVVVEGSSTNTNQQTAYVATGSHGLAVVNASQFNNPIILGQLNLPGDATDVAVDPTLNIAAVATNSGGLQLVNVADGMLPTLIQTININASQVEIANGIAYVTVGTSLRAIDLLTGQQLQQLTLPGSGTITDLARDGNYLYGYTSGSDTFFTVDINNATAASVKGQLTVSIASSDVGVFAGNGVAYLAGSGIRTINVSKPATPTLISGADNFFTARDVVLNGSGLGLVSQEGLGVGIYNLNNPQNTNDFVTEFNTPGFTYDVAIASGIAYVADGTGGLQVINYLGFDNTGIAPTVTITSPVIDLDPNQAGIQLLEGSSVPIQANVTDNVQVRNVELLVNGQVVSNDVSFPFDLNAIALSDQPEGTTATVQVRATDTGGNSSLSNTLTFELVPDTFAPQLVGITPNNGANVLIGSFRRITVSFNEPLDSATVTANTFQLVNAQNQVITPLNIQLRNGDRVIQLTYSDNLLIGDYHLVIVASQVTDRYGNALGATDVVSTFSVTRIREINLSELNGNNGFILNGIDRGDFSGFSVSSAGDINGDGFDDLLIGAFGANPNGQYDAEESYVVFGQAGGFTAQLNLSTLDGSNGFILNGIDILDYSGNSVSSAGDINGDGFDDLLIGAFLADPNGQDRAGESYVVFGQAEAFTAQLNLSTLDGSNGFILNGIDRVDYSGRSVSSAGDINGDGFDDLLIGAYKADPNGRSLAGESYVVFGHGGAFTAQLNLSTLDGSNGFILNGIDILDYSGFSVSSAGDINGDGFDDLLIGAGGADPNGQSFAGESYVVFGKAGGFTAQLDLSTLNGSNGFIINGIDSVDLSGISVSSAGDINGDGFDDLLIGATGADPNGQSGAGESYVVFGKAGGFTAQLNLSTLNGSNGFIINGIDGDDRSGNSVSSAGDINGDGFHDLLIGANGADPNGQSGAGESYVVFGQAGGFTAQLNLSTLNGSNGFILNGIDSGDYSGNSVSSAGDINGDGFDDLLIGAYRADPNGQSLAGETYVVFGGVQFAITQANRPPIIEDQTFTLNENSPNNTVVGSLVASDPDNNTFTYSLVGTNSAFAINPNTGQITVTDSTLLDFETNARFSLRVKVTDSSNLSDTATITIKLNDLPK